MSALKQEAPEEKYAKQQDECDDDNFDQAHSRFLKRLLGRVEFMQ
ncbi:MAG TPA: hypothetical protein VGN95_03380 [Pyrinomonadaceae bacterium]|jgi:hypothetical protein|nr:hypothetical protein [Pyrinomonadaceae bacterium]